MQKLKRGSVVGVRGPFGSSWPVDEAIGQSVESRLELRRARGSQPVSSGWLALVAALDRHRQIVVLVAEEEEDRHRVRTEDEIVQREAHRLATRLGRAGDLLQLVQVAAQLAIAERNAQAAVLEGLLAHGGERELVGRREQHAFDAAGAMPALGIFHRLFAHALIGNPSAQALVIFYPDWKVRK